MVSKKILIIGTEPPCPRCDYLTQMVKDIVSALGIQADVRHLAYTDAEARRLGESFGLQPGTAKDVARKASVDVNWDQVHTLIDTNNGELSCCSTAGAKWSPALDQALRPCEQMAHNVGIMMTPVLIMGDQLLHQGSVPDRETVIHWIQEYFVSQTESINNKHKVEVLGPGCEKCDTLYANVQQAVSNLDLKGNIAVRKRTDIKYFHKLSVFVTPALVINGSVISKGRVIPIDQIEEQIRAYISVARPRSKNMLP